PWQPTVTENAWRLAKEGNCLTFNGSENTNIIAFDEKHLQAHLNGFLPYNGPVSYKLNYHISDVKVSLLVQPQDEHSVLIITLTKYGRPCRAEVHFDGTCLLCDDRQVEPLRQTKLAPFGTAPVPIAFAVVDHQMILNVGGNQLLYEGSDDPKAWGYSNDAASSIYQVTLTAQGKPFTIPHLTLYRDVHYTNIDAMGHICRGAEGNPLTLGKNEFFVLGDNTAFSHDSRFWSEPSLSVSGATYPAGILPRENIIGRAVKIYWPPQRSKPIN
ncbi:MAG: hypothetical protein JW709_03585, partial [Sedimentisphaerales bacterium]|nr:hypothetical protein [Sedimentisphaerales bacterium]